MEGYLNNQKFYFLVEPAYYEQALRIYNKLKWEKSLNAYGLVDIGTLREREHIDPAERQSCGKGGDRKRACANLHGLSARTCDVL